jgi:uncharacterized membrane protein YgcG
VTVDSCRDILEPGTYELVANLSAQQSPCIQVVADNVTLLGGDHVVEDATGDGATGLLVASDLGPRNITVQDLTVRGWAGVDIRVRDARDVTLRNVTVANASEAGLVSNATEGLEAENLTARDNGDGVRAVEGSTNLSLADAVATGNTGDGYALADVQGLDVLRSEAADNGGAGIRLAGVTGPSLVDVAAHGNGGAGLSATGTDPISLEGLDLGSALLDGETWGTSLGSATRPSDPPDPYRTMDRHVEVEILEDGAWANLTAAFGADEVLDYQDETIRWWRWDGADWSELPGYNVVETGTREVTGNATGSGVLAPLVEEDVTPPTTQDDSPSRWVNTSVLVTLSARDDASGVASTSYRVDGGDWLPYGDPVDVSVEGNHTLEYRSEDREANLEDGRTTTVRLDRTPPTTGLELSGNRTGDGLWEAPVEVILPGDDDRSNVNSTRYRLDDGPVKTYNGTFTIREAGNHTLTYWSRDRAGNREATNRDHVAVRGQDPPTTSLNVTPSQPEGDRGWYLAPPSVRVVSDPATATPHYQLDEGKRTRYQDPVEVPAGVHDLEYWSTSPLRPNETHKEKRFRVDVSRPQVTEATLSTERLLLGESAEVSLRVRDEGAGVDDAWAIVGGGDGPLTVSLEEGADGRWSGILKGEEVGTHEIQLRARDQAGRRTTVAAGTLTVACPEEGGTCSPDVGVLVEPADEEGRERVRARNPPDPSNTTLVLVGPDGSEEVLGRGAEATWDTRDYENGYYRVVARADGGGGDGGEGTLTLASTEYLVENPRASLEAAVLAVAAGVLVTALAGAGGGYGLQWLRHLVKVVRRALGIEYRERTKETALRWRILRQVAAATVAAAVLGSAVTLAGLPDWGLASFLAKLPVLGGAAVVFSVVWYGGDWLLAKLTDRTPRYVLLASGVTSLIVTTWALRSPFGTPGYVEKEDTARGLARERYEARRTLADLGVIASAGLVFAPSQLWLSYDFGSTGLLLVAVTLGTGSVPLSPLPNHKVWRWRRGVALAVFAGGTALYVGFQRAWFPAEVFAVVGAVGLAVVAVFTVLERRRAGGPPGSDREAEPGASSRGRGYGRGRRRSGRGGGRRGGGRGGSYGRGR